ncbi:hypothetical protein DPMN_016069, partial [Dreissena polymorpha]
MFCKVCRAANKQNSFTKEGAENLQRSTVVKHNDCQEHKHAQEAEQLRRRLYDVQKSPEHDVPVKCSESEMHLFRATYFTAKENLPNSFVNAQLNFLALSGVNAHIKDIHSDTVQGVQQSLLHVLSSNLSKDVQATRIPDGTAATIATEILRELRVLGVDPVNMVGLGSDGASVMFGVHNGHTDWHLPALILQKRHSVPEDIQRHAPQS